MKIAVYGKPFEKQYAATIIQLFERLKAHQVPSIVHRSFYEFLRKQLQYTPKAEALFDTYYNMPEHIDFIFSIGGDGTFLQTVAMVRDKEIPIIGLNIGRLGFLADIQEDEIEDALLALFDKQYEIEERTLLQASTTNKAFAPFDVAMNDVAVHKKNAVSMITIHAYINDVLLNAYWADGLIIASPTGSTAYSLSVGGPIVIPSAKNFIITPIAPHNLTVRPVVVPDDSTIHLRISGRANSYLASLDSRLKVLDTAQEVTIKKAPYHVKMLKLPERHFYATLRNKLMWGMDKRN